MPELRVNLYISQGLETHYSAPTKNIWLCNQFQSICGYRHIIVNIFEFDLELKK